MTKLLLSLLALLTGFSAAEASRPVESSHAALGSAAAFAAVVVADQAVQQGSVSEQLAPAFPALEPVLGNAADVALPTARTQRSDRSRE